jgi:hypothetical protein
MHGEVINVYKILVKKPERNIPLGRPQHRWDNNIKMDLRETGLKGVDWIDVGSMAGCCEHSNELSGWIKIKDFLVQLRILLASEGLCSTELVQGYVKERRDGKLL